MAFEPTSKDCNYYRTVEEDYACGAEGYPLNFGYRLCQKYLESESKITPRLKNWFPKVRFCLQNFIETERGGIRDCDELHHRAIASHIPCYQDTGFCSLPMSDQLLILKITHKDILNMDILSMGLKIQVKCRQN